MALKPIKRKYGFSDATLDELGDSLLASGRRDIDEMTTYGYDDARLDDIEDKVSEFKEFPKDEYYTGLMAIATAAKNISIKNMSEVAEGIVRRATTKFGKNAPEVNMYGWTGFITKTDSEKVRTCRLVHKTATGQLAALASEGLTAPIVADLMTKIGLADEAITEKDTKVKERDIAVNQRITLGNTLYQLIVDLADTGKHIWEDTDESKYNDYVIYESQAGQQTVSGTVAPGTIHQPSVVVDNVADEIEITVEDGELIAYFSDDPTNEPAPGQVTVTVNAATPYEGTAADLGWSTTNNRLLFKNAADTPPAPFVVKVKD